MVLKCVGCNKEYSEERIKFTCDTCGRHLEVSRELTWLTDEEKKHNHLGVWRYKDLLLITSMERIVSLGEGNTPLIKCNKLARSIGLKKLYLKCEHISPTGSFKDRGITVAVSKALELKLKNIFCASTGNTAASLAAYSAKAGINAVFILPKNVPKGKLAQIIGGGKTLRINGNFDDAMSIVKEIGNRN